MEEREHDVLFFNNCRGREHAAIYGPGAFFDLDVAGPQSKQALDLPVGQKCVVASYAEDGRIVFDWYAFVCERTLDDNKDNRCRVFFGELFSTETLDKSTAAQSNRYSTFFNVNGHFKRPSVLRGKVLDSDLPRGKQSEPTRHTKPANRLIDEAAENLRKSGRIKCTFDEAIFEARRLVESQGREWTNQLEQQCNDALERLEG